MAKAPPRIGVRPPQTERECKQKLDQRRLSSAQRGYDAAWQRVRDAVIFERGLRCEACGRLGALRKRDATPSLPVLNVDHIIGVAERPDLRLAPSNLRVLHHGCHSRRTGAATDSPGAGRAGRRGWPLGRGWVCLWRRGSRVSQQECRSSSVHACSVRG